MEAATCRPASVLLIGGLGLAGTMDHTTELWLTGVYTAILGLGLGMLMQNLVLAVQNTVQATDIGTASASVAFFRSVGGAIGVSVLGAVLGNRVTRARHEGLAAAGIPVPGRIGRGQHGPRGHAGTRSARSCAPPTATRRRRSS